MIINSETANHYNLSEALIKIGVSDPFTKFYAKEVMGNFKLCTLSITWFSRTISSISDHCVCGGGGGMVVDLKNFDEGLRRDVVGLDVELFQRLVVLERAGQVGGGEVAQRRVGHRQILQRFVVTEGVENFKELQKIEPLVPASWLLSPEI